jgi:hypothetical protein
MLLIRLIYDLNSRSYDKLIKEGCDGYRVNLLFRE